ncbi:lipopolysaccharide biosynthesis protein [Terrihabitans sp. B22-R8]|uniref:lipopolysaccharide biosynthesis protein n=1 Tax=Terrihabitans sp. B22-R8 TaxID=3425128 RepID=UPI00403C2C83
MTTELAGRRIRGAFLAHGLGRGVRLLEQFLLVPLLLAGWGTDLYGSWLTLNSLGALAALASFGIGHAASADIVMRHAEGDTQKASETFITSMTLLAATTLTAILLVWLALRAWPLPDSVVRMAPAEAEIVLLMAALAILLSFWLEPLIGALSATLGAGFPNAITAFIKMAEIAGIAVVMALTGSPVTVAGVLLGSVVANLAILLFFTWRKANWLSWRVKHLSLDPIRRSWKASLGSYLVFLGFNIVSIHAPRLIVSHELGASMVTVFTVMVTYTRTARSLAGLVVQSMQVEIGRAAASAHWTMLRTMISSALGGSVACCALLLAVALSCAPWMIPLWTHGQIAVDWPILLSLSAVALAGSLFDTLLNITISVKRVLPVAMAYCLGLLLGLVTGWFLIPFWGLVAPAGIGMLLPEIVGAWIGLRVIKPLLGGQSLAARACFVWPWRFLNAIERENQP